jgi:TM2 domain-containing membrane protein YozV
VPSHTVGNWRQEPDYLIAYEFIPPGGSPRNALLNSCMLERLSSTLQCNGRGVCKRWNDEDLDNPTAFCECDRDWADPECRTRRKSQAVAWVLSLFFGYLGADYFYLGSTMLGVLKFVTLGGAGVWWVIDVIRIGSAPVQGGRFKTAADLPHWAFVLSTVMFAVLTGFLIAWHTAIAHIQQRRKDAFLMQMEEEQMMRPSDGKALARLVPPELMRLPPETKLYLDGREDFDKPPAAPSWAVQGKQPPYAGAAWYGSTGDDRPPTKPPSAPSVRGAEEPPTRPPSVRGSKPPSVRGSRPPSVRGSDGPPTRPPSVRGGAGAETMPRPPATAEPLAEAMNLSPTPPVTTTGPVAAERQRLGFVPSSLHPITPPGSPRLPTEPVASVPGPPSQPPAGGITMMPPGSTPPPTMPPTTMPPFR